MGFTQRNTGYFRLKGFKLVQITSKLPSSGGAESPIASTYHIRLR